MIIPNDARNELHALKCICETFGISYADQIWKLRAAEHVGRIGKKKALANWPSCRTDKGYVLKAPSETNVTPIRRKGKG